jgi:prophage antirepressor-like protein
MTPNAPIAFAFDDTLVRTLNADDDIWFVAGDVAGILGYRDAANMIRMLDDDEKGTQIVRTPGGPQEVAVINESGLYSAILKSRRPEAKLFKKWVTAEVLPAIRRHGHYGNGPSVDLTPLVTMLSTLTERMDQRDVQVMTFLATLTKRRSARDKTPITSEHERQALQLQAEGMDRQEIGDCLGISLWHLKLTGASA